MTKPHVVALRYRVESAGYVIYDKPPPVTWITEAFQMRLEEGVATFQMLDHYVEEDKARACVQEYLDKWQAHSTLAHGLLL